MHFTHAQLHFLFETLAYCIGFRYFLRERKRFPDSPLADAEHRWMVIAGAVLGAGIGAKMAYWAYDPVFAFSDFPDWRHLLQGKSVIGALLGGLVGVELGKRLSGVTSSTGDAFVRPLALGMALGRVGCFLAGLEDHTYGNATALPWGVDFGDGIPRHPTQVYEMLFILPWGFWAVDRIAGPNAQAGDRFRLFLAGYFAYRLCIEFIRPAPCHWLGLSGLQWWCVAGLTYYARDVIRIARNRHG